MKRSFLLFSGKNYLRNLIICFPIFIFVFFISCGHKNEPTIKLHPEDPFKSTMVPSEFFSISGRDDIIVEGKQGTIIICPKGCFLDENGNVVYDNVKIELAEAYSLNDMLLSNLTTTSGGKPLVTDGMIYFNATADGKQLTINKDIPIHIEMPTAQKKPNMMVYKGVRDENGNMNWIDPIETDHFINTVDLTTLDFLPEGFQREVENGLPFRNRTEATPELVDSLYYSLNENEESIDIVFFVDLLFSGRLNDSYLNGAYYDDNGQIKNIRHNPVATGFHNPEQKASTTPKCENCDSAAYRSYDCGIDPAIIKTIKDEKFQNSLIATKEFESRMKVIHKTCDNDILELYIQNLNKNLFEIDELAEKFCRKNGYFDCADAFKLFADQKLTKVKQSDKYAAMLADYYNKKLTQVRSELAKNRNEALAQSNQEESEFSQLIIEYKDLLWKNEKYQMESYGFNWTETGWINIDNGTLPKSWANEPLKVIATNGNDFERIYTYVFFTSNKSLSRLENKDKEVFYSGSVSNSRILMPKNTTGIVISIGYNENSPSLAVQEFITCKNTEISVNLRPVSSNEISEALAPFDNAKSEYSVSEDLEFQAKIFEENKKRNTRLNERFFIQRLYNVAFPCCAMSFDN